MRVISLFSGIGGFDAALERMGHTTVAYSEVDPWACSVMAARFPEARPLGDITRIDWSTVDRPDILCGGFPCQDISVAGRQAGLAGARSGLWSEFARAIRDLQPGIVIVENVPNLLTLGMDTVLGDLAALGYDAEWQVLSAADVGAPHRRERVWIVAHTGCGSDGAGQQELRAERRPPALVGESGALAHRDGAGCEQFGVGGLPQDGDPQPKHDAVRCDRAWPTPRTEDGESTGISATRRAKGIADNLPSAVWATPHTAQGGPDHARQHRAGSGGVDLVTQVNGKLNPDWVETLMGYPIGWTDPAVSNDELAWTPFPAGPGPQFDWEPPRVTTRKDGRRKRLRCLGNAIVPASLAAALFELNGTPTALEGRRVAK